VRAWLPLLLLAGCSKSDDDQAWEAFQKELAEGLPPASPDAAPEPLLPSWYALPDAFYDAWFGSGTGQYPHRPTWEAQRRLSGEMEKAGLLAREVGFASTPPSDKAIDHLLAAAEDVDPHRRARALFILADAPRLGGRPELRARIVLSTAAALADRDGLVRASAAWSLGRLLEGVEIDPAPVAGELAPLLKDPEFFVRHNAACALAGLGKAPDAAVVVLREHLERQNWWIVSGSTVALLKIGAPRAKEAVPALVRLLRHPHEACRKNAYAALEKLDPDALKDSPAAERVRNELENRLPQPK
jgi:HEAT repeat protein